MQGVAKAAAAGELKAADSPKGYWDLVLENRVKELEGLTKKRYQRSVRERLCVAPMPELPGYAPCLPVMS